jgi:pimeloyl-ACP methyl ester carboxylesterase
VPTLRIDLDGIGDSDGDAGRYRDVGQFYARDELAEQIRLLTDELASRTGAGRIILAGLCAGGYWAFRAADLDPRVVAAYLLNPGALEWRTDLVRRRDARRLRRVADPAWWRRLARGQVRIGRIRSIAAAAVGEGIRGRIGSSASSTGSGQTATSATAPADIADRLDARGATVVMAFSSDEALREELSHDGFLARVASMANVHLETLPGRDHTLRPIAAQRAVHELLDRSLLADLARLGVRTDTGAA